MDEQTKYLLALGAFRRSLHAMTESAQGLRAAAEAMDPSGTATDNPVAVQIFDECLHDLRGVFALSPGMHQLFSVAVGV